MNKAEKVIKRLEEKTKTFSVKLLGNEKNKENGFHIMALNQRVDYEEKDMFHGINQDTIDLLKEADIDFKII